MDLRNTYWIATLSALLSLSLALPYCYHADISEVFSHHQETAAHGQHSDSESEACDCGHEFVKDYQKTKKVANSQTLLLSSAVLISDRESLPISTDILSNPFIQSGVRNNSGPPLHLLNSIFLN